MLGEIFYYTSAVDNIKNEVNGIIEREGMQTISIRGADLPAHNYPMVVHVKKTDIPTVTQGADVVDTVDLSGRAVSIRVKKILGNDPETWVLGAA